MAISLSQACDRRPPVVAEGYEPKGVYETHGGLSSYITGPREAKKGIFFIYDIFGFKSQTLQGADILSSSDYLVVMPDFWEGQPSQVEWYARDTEEKKQAIAEFRDRSMDNGKYIAKLQEVMGSLKSAFPNVTRWGSIGSCTRGDRQAVCWGGKICTLTSGTETPWAVAIESSPSRMEVEDGKGIKIPFASLLSKDESQEAFKAKHDFISGPKLLEVFPNQIHGWMTARGKLNDPEVKKDYERGYAMALDWFEKYL